MLQGSKLPFVVAVVKPLSHWNAATGDLFANSSRLFRDTDYKYKYNFHVAVSLNRPIFDKFANFGLILKIYLAAVARPSHDFPTNVLFSFYFHFYFHFHAYDSRATFERVSHYIRTNVA